MKEVIRKIFYTIGSSSLAGRISKKYIGLINILMFHRILPPEESEKDFSGNSIDVYAFESIIKFLRENYIVITMDELVDHLRNNTATSQMVVVTFDDGYYDTLKYALPIMEKYGISATLYLTTAFAEGTARLWWYRLLHGIWQKQSLFDPIHRKNISCESVSEKRRAYRLFWNYLKAMEEVQQNQFFALLDIPPISCESVLLSWNGVKKLVDSGCFCIGCHTHSHGNFQYLSKNEIENDIKTSLELMSKHLPMVSIKHFAYPYGKFGQFVKTLAYISQFKFLSAVTTEIYPIDRDCNIFALPRHAIGPKNCSVKDIKIKLSGWNAFWKLQF
jgi:peptidoglycan/xylan/chitin deacetylase (PgdA/CDA1 family)